MVTVIERSPPLAQAAEPDARPLLPKAAKKAADVAAAAKPEAERYELRDVVVKGLRLVVQPSGVKSWAYRYRFNGENRRYTIGQFPTINVVDARELADAASRKATVRKIDPAAEKAEARRLARAGIAEATLFSKSWSDWQAAPKPKSRNQKGWRPSTAKRVADLYKNTLESLWGKRRLAEISTEDVRGLIDPIAAKHPQAAARMRRVLASFFNWCVLRGRLTKSPCAGIETAKTVKRKRKLTDAELRWLWRACEREPFPMGLLVRMLLLTLARRNEVAGMRDREVHKGNRRMWIIPPERTKNHHEHEVFLTDAMLETLKAVPRVANKASLVFCTNGKTPFSGFSKAKKRLDELMLEIAREDDPEVTVIPNWTLHDLRRTAASRMQRLADNDTVNACLNHVSEDAYLQDDFEANKAQAFDAWSRELLRIVV